MAKIYQSYTKDMPKMCQRCANNMPQICKDMPKICQINAKYNKMPKVYQRYSKDMLKLCQEFRV